MRVKHPSELPCEGELVCVPVDDCPEGWTLMMETIENPSGAAVPILRDHLDGYAIVELVEEGDFQLLFTCCPP